MTNQDMLKYGEAWLSWKLKPRIHNAKAPNPADYNLSPAEGQAVIDTCTRLIEQDAVERATGRQRPSP